MGSAAENFDALFRERLENHEEPPKAEVWDNIAEKLGHTRKKRALVFFMRIAAGMLLTLSLGIGYYYYTSQRTETRSSLAAGQQEQEKPAISDHETMQVKETNVISQKQKTESFVTDEKHTASVISVTDAVVPDEPAAVNVVPAITNEQQSGLLAVTDIPERMYPHSAIIENEVSTPSVEVQPCDRNAGIVTETDLILQQNVEQLVLAEDGESDKKSWMIGGQVAPLFSYRNLNSDYMDSREINALDDVEKGVMAYAGGIALAYAPTKRLSIQSGLYYSKYGQEKTDVKAIASASPTYEYISERKIQVAITNSTGVITSQTEGSETTEYGNALTQPGVQSWGVVYIEDKTDRIMAPDIDREVQQFTAFQYFEYFEVPLMLKYKVIDRKLDFSLLGGITTNFLAGNNVELDDDGTRYDFSETAEIARVNYSGSVGLGLEYPVITNLLFSLEPKFRYYLNPAARYSGINVFPYSVGIFAGISFVF
ncbi:MAG: outer membrane beta-barrel protein [Bacteroidales bacterium]|nr:outer membrane beta-barrel protein [Bacteroidales bacterium]MBN2762761.1 outer membrane beta-barrel protein [Bacteroidales bacterium]